MTAFNDVAPVLIVADLRAAIDRYRLLGFEVTAHAGGGYAFARRDVVYLHLAEQPDNDPATSNISAYLYVDDAQQLFDEWQTSAADGRLIAPSPTDYGLNEGAYIDPDGNLLRFGSFIDRDR